MTRHRALNNNNVFKRDRCQPANRRRLRMESLECRRVLACVLSGSEFFCESFEAASPPGDSGMVSSGTDTPFSLSPNDHWNRTNGSNITNASSGGFTNTSNTYSGQDGEFFWALEDSNGDGGAAAKTLDITGINIAGYTELSLSGRFAADGQVLAGTYRFDPLDHIRVTYQIDGGGYNNLLAFESDDAVNNNRPIFQDTDFNGVGEGTQLVPSFQVFSQDILGAGSTLDIRISTQSDGSSEELAFDDLRISGMIPEPSSGVLVALGIPMMLAAHRSRIRRPCRGGVPGSLRKRPTHKDNLACPPDRAETTAELFASDSFMDSLECGL